MTNHVVLFAPEIPANTGNIARTCAGTGAYLHLIRPLGFSLTEKKVKRAGLDYWDHVQIVFHDSLDDFMADLPKSARLFLITKFSNQVYTEVDYPVDADNYLMFGRETKGLPENFLRENEEKCLRIPMTEQIRSLNLANSVAIVLFEALRQQNFSGLELNHQYQHDKLK
ncbi:tRNA (uridine(34)/cytosine(34)/5-carboxymethylaminomethyluridine(34)-2'-O)-methyltransferase TrmL [Xylocopilactobacillus apicola]|uniref:Putative tRNA (cytidine(34)-2'-O)-methyltransferase n=1 Tax=Xylocopilactobacillus apicola TaxID=2932184 RepID=A0AAU9DXI9_9LACO|nr:tRNA (uridine(34)/cytosine(34)/5-carboxymethylaminomethyluridine(34)-2'-O)-methyltransferase TrmL [Xylocopilactobacillus apicola]BDR58833.1 putative tRNA (cytidine(34)-2'-O)-methyltransferase [Xylocopilactobacillus apicola]